MLSKCFCTLKLAKKGSKSVSKSMKDKEENIKYACKRAIKSAKSKLKPHECGPQCDKLITKRRIRSKIDKEKEPTCTYVKSAVMGKGTAIKRKRVTKSFEDEPYACIPDHCDVSACIENLKARGIISPEVGQSKMKKLKQIALSAQKVEEKTDKKGKTLLKRCLSILTLKKTREPTSHRYETPCEYSEPNIDSDIKETDITKFMRQCICTLTQSKRGRLLAPKQSMVSITDVKNKNKLKCTRSPKPTLKLEKKRVDKTKEVVTHNKVEIILPYSKKKFKKLESKADVTQEASTTVTLYPCICAEKKTVNKTLKKYKGSKLQNEDKLTNYLCKSDKNDRKQVVKKSLPPCSSSNELLEDQSYNCEDQAIGKHNKKQNIKKAIKFCICPKNKPKLCSECKSPVSSRLNKITSLHLDFCTCKTSNKSKSKKKKDGKKSLYTYSCPNEQLEDYAYLCSKCKTISAKSKKGKNKSPHLHLQDEMVLCPECQVIEKEKHKNLYLYSNEQVGDHATLCPICKTVSKKSKEVKSKKAPYSSLHPDKQMIDQMNLCPECQAIERKKHKKTQDLKESLYSCLCPNEKVANYADLCPICKTISEKSKKAPHSSSPPDKEVVDQTDLCSECQAIERNKQKKNKRDAKKFLRTYLNPNKLGIIKLLQVGDQMQLCPICKAYANAKLVRKKRGDKKYLYPFHCSEERQRIIAQYYGKMDLCSICKAKFIPVVNKIIQKYSSILNCRKEIEKPEKPLFEVLVNQQNMNIINSDEVISRLGPGKESSVTEDAQKGANKKKNIVPLMEMLINKDNASIINPDEVLNKIIPYEKREKRLTSTTKSKIGNGLRKCPIKHNNSERTASSYPQDSKCLCCRCRRKRGAKYSLPRSGAGDGKVTSSKVEISKRAGSKGADSKEMKVATKPRKFKACVCGSITCKKNWEKLRRSAKEKSSFKVKPCVCGSDICKIESQKMPILLQKAAKKQRRAHEKVLNKIEAEKKYQRERLVRKKLYATEDAARWKLRRKQDKRDMKQVKKYEDETPDMIKAAESLLDFGRFGAKALCDVIRCTYRVIRHPRDGVHNARDAIKRPDRVSKEIKKTCKGMGFFATMARIRRRLFGMKVTKNALTRLESHSVTNFIVHLPDKDPKKRMKQKKRHRETLDFECNLFMASLRKRPCLWIYYMCPWFYPHCLSILTVWKQFTDIVLFILAVGVWSPCILCMELCRAMVCCCLCTG